MAIKQFKPTSPARRFFQVADFSGLAKKPTVRGLLVKKSRSGGRNNLGRITAWHRGGGHKQTYRIIDFRRDKDGIPARVAAIEYDPNRTAYIALLNYVDGERRYILAPSELKVGETLMSGAQSEIKSGNCLPLKNMPLGSVVYNLEIKLGKGGQLIRSAGTSGQIMAKENGYVQVRLPTGEVRMVPELCRATIGSVSNPEHVHIKLGKAGRNRWLGWRPTVRGVAMNPVDHPMGGGEGKTSGGRNPVSPWGWKTKGYKTRNTKKPSDKYIVKRRK